MPLIAAVVLGLHALLCWLLLVRTREVLNAAGPSSIEIVLIPPPRKAPERNRAATQARAPSKHESPRSPAPASAPVVPTTPEPAPGQAIHPSVDFEAELARAAADAAAAAANTAAGIKPRDFGSPHAERAPAREPEFGWDYAHTHRVESMPGGGLLVNLNDKCVLVFLPLPFVLCRPGHKPANGELFKDMAQPSATDDLRAAP